MTLVDLLNIPRIGDPQISPDGRAISLHAVDGGLAGQPARRASVADQRRRLGPTAAVERTGAAAERALVAR